MNVLSFPAKQASHFAVSVRLRRDASPGDEHSFQRSTEDWLSRQELRAEGSQTRFVVLADRELTPVDQANALLAMMDIRAVRQARVGPLVREGDDLKAKLTVHGFPEAGNEGLIGSSGLLPGLLSIYLNRPVGSRHLHIDSVVKDLRRSVGPRRTTASVFLIALKAYPQAVTARLQPWVDDWATEVRDSIKARQEMYLRDPVYDRLLSVLFPEMAAGLAKRGGKLECPYG